MQEFIVSTARTVLSKYLLLLLALLLVVTFSVLVPDTFPTVTTARSILDAMVIVTILAIAEMLIIIIGEYDLSIGFVVGLLHILMIGLIVKQNIPWPLAIVLVLSIGTVIGLVNGILVYYFRINSFIATLGTGTIAYGLSNWYTNGQQLFGSLPKGFTNIYSAKLFGLPVAAVYVIVITSLAWFVLEYTKTGRQLYALGANRRAAELTGISSRKIVLGTYVFGGLIVAIAAIILASRLRTGSVSTGPDYLLPIFVGAILGSTTINPGRPNPWGTVIAVMLLGIGISGLQQLGAQFFVVPLFNGVTLILGVGLATYSSGRGGNR
ncbi:ABC transporter permease [Mesorhizobium sp. M0047]|uniref:ABC transporter permease n=1 Tax=Mesorhizobium sp. M0047 TaxID=2956859 RepID=UPI0033350FE9